MPKRLGIYRVEFEFEDCTDRRPCVVISPQWYLDDSPRSILVLPMSGQMDLFKQGCHFLLDPGRADFGETGLDRKCYALLEYITFVKPEALGRNFGVLEKSLASGFIAALAGFLGIS